MLSSRLIPALCAAAWTLAAPAAEPGRPAAPAALLPAPVAPVAPPSAGTAAKPATERQDIRAQLSPQRYTTLAAEIGAKVNRLLGPEGGSFKLRHTFALRQLRRGTAPQQVAQWLGLSDVAALARYRMVLIAPAEVT